MADDDEHWIEAFDNDHDRDDDEDDHEDDDEYWLRDDD